MGDEVGGYPENIQSPGYRSMALGKLRKSSTPEILRQKKQKLEEELKQVNDALEVLEKMPELEKALHLISIALG